MLKLTLLAGAMLIAAPALAQQISTSPQTVPPSSANPAPANPATANPATTMTGPMSGPLTGTTAPQASSIAPSSRDAATRQPPTAEAAPAGEPVTGAAQIAQVVDAEFSAFDKDANGTLNMSEFGTWMVALRSATDKSITAESKGMKDWNKSAFAQADTDKSMTVSKTELTGFLAQPQG